MQARLLVTAFLLSAVPVAANPAAPAANRLAAHKALAADYDRVIAELTVITETPAPPFKEAKRAELIAAKFRALGLQDVTIDKVGNVTGLRPGRDPKAKLLVVAAHLDTVFPEGTPIKVRREGTRLLAPGIGDDTVNLANMLAWVRALDAGKVVTPRSILFVADVGEEGRGDLRGMRYLFGESGWKSRIGDFISFDGSSPDSVTNGGVGSRRYRVNFTGPGGHSYGAFGTVNPMVAMAETVTGLYAIKVPTDPKTTYAASVVSGGTSVNAIPDKIALEVDMRSREQGSLDALEAKFLAIVKQSVIHENAARSTSFGSVAAEPVLIGDRRTGQTAANDPLVRAAAGALVANGYPATLRASSTDANVAMSLGIPAITVGAGAGGGRAHSVDEYIETEPKAFMKGLAAGLDIILAAVAVKR
jgi:tripeptide aminopeptidase